MKLGDKVFFVILATVNFRLLLSFLLTCSTRTTSSLPQLPLPFIFIFAGYIYIYESTYIYKYYISLSYAYPFYWKFSHVPIFVKAKLYESRFI